MADTPLVSVRIPAYNHERYIHACILSVLNQSYQNFEIVIVDDCSTDGTVSVIRRFTDPRIKLAVHKRNEGMNVTVEHCMKRCRGKYVANMCSDDVWMPDKLEKQVAFLEQNAQVDAVFTGVQLIGENGKPLPGFLSRRLSLFDCANRSAGEWLAYFFRNGNCLCNPSVMMRRQVYKAFGYQDKRMLSLSDFDLWVKFSFEHSFWILEEPLTQFRVRRRFRNASALTPKTLNRQSFERQQILDHYLQIRNAAQLLRIFPEAAQYGQPADETIPYFLGRLAIDTGIPDHMLWGCETIFRLMDSKAVCAVLARKYNFRYVDFIKLTAETNAFFQCQGLSTGQSFQKAFQAIQARLDQNSCSISPRARSFSRILSNTSSSIRNFFITRYNPAKSQSAAGCRWRSRRRFY